MRERETRSIDDRIDFDLIERCFLVLMASLRNVYGTSRRVNLFVIILRILFINSQ